MGPLTTWYRDCRDKFDIDLPWSLFQQWKWFLKNEISVETARAVSDETGALFQTKEKNRQRQHCSKEHDMARA